MRGRDREEWIRILRRGRKDENKDRKERKV